MVSILRSPVISDEKRKLATRRARDAEATAVPASPLSSDNGNSGAANLPQPSAASAPAVEQLLAQARESVLAQFKQEAETARELGRQRGLQEGRAQGVEEARADFAAELARIRSVSAKLHGALESGINGVEDMALAIAFEAVCKMLGTAAVTKEGVQALVKEAASHAARSARVTVRLHPGDLAVLTDAGGADSVLASDAQVSWLADSSIELGGCVVETDGGTLDARIETQLGQLRSVMLAARQTGS